MKIKHFLHQNKYFDYDLLACVIQCDLPFITKDKGKIVLESKIKVKKKSLGCGGLFYLL